MKARSFEEIYSDHLYEKTTLPDLIQLQTTVSDVQTLLQELNSDSRTARWGLEIFVVDRCIWALENIVSQASNDIETIRDNSFSGNNYWLIDKAKKFQYGSDIVTDESTNFVPSYTVIDTAQQIIKNASINEVNGKVILKICGRDSNVLGTDEFNSFSSYIKNNIKFAGQRILIQNLPADKLKIIGNIRYKGTFTQSDIQSIVETNINTYIQNIGFDSFFVTTDLIDVLKALDGIIDFEINSLESRPDSSQTFLPIVHRVNSTAGYFEIDPNYSLNSYITYQSV